MWSAEMSGSRTITAVHESWADMVRAVKRRKPNGQISIAYKGAATQDSEHEYFIGTFAEFQTWEREQTQDGYVMSASGQSPVIEIKEKAR
jgi:hypothetical protein